MAEVRKPVNNSETVISAGAGKTDALTRFFPLAGLAVAGAFLAFMFFMYTGVVSRHGRPRNNLFDHNQWAFFYLSIGLGIVCAYAYYKSRKKKYVTRLVFNDAAKTLTIRLIDFYTNHTQEVSIAYEDLRVNLEKNDQRWRFRFSEKKKLVIFLDNSDHIWRNETEQIEKLAEKLKKTCKHFNELRG